MLELRKIAITGGLAAGKSTVCQFFKELGAYVVSADAIVHRLLSPKTDVGRRVIALLGSDILKGEVIDRKKVSEKVFSHPDKLHALETIIHPAVFDAIETHYQQIKETEQYRLFLAEIPLLYEIAASDRFDAVIAVTAAPALCKKRFKESETQFDARNERQLDPQIKERRADYVLQNNGTLEELRAQVNALFNRLIQGV